jgi:heme exporter protein D
MYFDSVHALLTMDGHGVYVWSAYLVTIAVIATTLLAPRYRRKRLLQQLMAEYKRSKGAPGVSNGEQN